MHCTPAYPDGYSVVTGKLKKSRICFNFLKTHQSFYKTTTNLLNSDNKWVNRTVQCLSFLCVLVFFLSLFYYIEWESLFLLDLSTKCAHTHTCILRSNCKWMVGFFAEKVGFYKIENYLCLTLFFMLAFLFLCKIVFKSLLRKWVKIEQSKS